jgi:capsular polysaccharide biosynthesis protein
MSENNGIGALVDRITSKWPVVLAGVAAGILLAAIVAFAAAPEPGYTASTKIRYIAPQGVTGAPTADTFVALALSRTVQESAAASAGVDPAQISETALAAIDSRDKSIIVVRATGPDAETAVRIVNALAEAAKEKTMEPVRNHEVWWQDKIAAKTEQLEVIDSRIDRINAQLESDELTTSERRALEELAFINTIRRAETQQDLDDTTFLLGRSATTLTTLEEPETVANSSLPRYLSSLLRGALIGLFAGLLVAALVTRRESASASDA